MSSEEQQLPDLSVLVAAENGDHLLRKCLAALVPQLPPSQMEVIVVVSPAGAPTERAELEFPSVQFLKPAGLEETPQLWKAGMAASKGRIVALTIANCVPALDWAQRVIEAHAEEWPAIGGAIEADPACSVVDWAVYFCRYSSYMLPFPRRFLDDLAADNCSYKREALDPVKSLAADGFWETFIHADMRRRNQRLLCDPALVVTYQGGLPGWRFWRRRFRHGRYFAARRSLHFTRMQHLARAAASPLIPLLLLRRIAGRVWRTRRHRGWFLAALPLITAFLVAWGFGEAAGYWKGSVREHRAEK